MYRFVNSVEACSLERTKYRRKVSWLEKLNDDFQPNADSHKAEEGSVRGSGELFTAFGPRIVATVSVSE